jgi:Scaffold protein Nfu/NifU N terminal/HEAT repeats
VVDPGPELDAARARVVERGLTAEAAGQLLQVVSDLSLDELGTVKQLVKRFFSNERWSAADDDALADAVAIHPGAGRHELEPGLTLVWGSEDGRFRLRVESATGGVDRGPGPSPRSPAARGEPDLGTTFDGAVVPEATPSPRTIRFATPELHAGPGRTYDSVASAAADARVERLFIDFGDVTSVLVGPDFVAVTVSRPDLWEQLLAPILRAVSDEFTAATDDSRQEPEPVAPMTITLSAGAGDPEREPRRLERAWAELGGLRPDQPEHLDRVLAAAHDDEPARRQVAAALLTDAPADIAKRSWEHLLGDPSRVVRRSTVDAVAGATRAELRPLLEQALDDADAWTRWKALRGIADLGVGASRAAVSARADDPDFRVRLEAARMLSSSGKG